MKTEKEGVKVVLPEGTKEITIRDGKAIDPKEKARVILVGTIEAPRKFAEKRTIEKTKALVIIDDQQGNSTITLITDEHGELDNAGNSSDKITGKIETHQALKDLPINNDKNMSLDDFRTWVRKNAQAFASFDEHKALTANLVKFTGTVQKIIKGEKDTRGNSLVMDETTLKSDLKESFCVGVPILKGGPKESFVVDICMSAHGNGVSFWLESNDLKKLMDERITAKINEEKKYFEDEGYCIIYKA